MAVKYYVVFSNALLSASNRQLCKTQRPDKGNALEREKENLSISMLLSSKTAKVSAVEAKGCVIGCSKATTLQLPVSGTLP